MRDVLKNYQFAGPKKSRKKRWKLWLLISSLAVCFLVLIFLLKAVLSWSGLNVKEINVTNDSHVGNSHLLGALTNQMLQSRLRALLGPENILFWGIGKKPSSLQNLPEIASVSVSASLFSRTVSIDALPRVPFGVICEATSTTCFVFDDSGVIFSQSPDVEGPLILKVNDMTGRHLMLGENVLPESTWLDNFLGTLKSLKAANFAVAQVTFDDFSSREWSVNLLDGPVFYFSFDATPDNLSYILANLSARLDFKKATYVDFRVPDRIYYK